MKFLEGLKAPLHISHRGGAALYPENTMVAFRAALSRWATDVLELDVHLSKDGEVVVAHDPTLDRCTDGTGPLAALTFAELERLDAGYHLEGWRGRGAKIPRFAEVLREFPGRINVELKVPGVLDAFVALVKKEGVIDRLCMGSEHDELAQALHAKLPGACHFYPANALAAYVLPVQAGEPGDDDPERRYTVLDMPLEWEGVRLFTPALREVCAKAGKWINVWTVNDPVEMRRVISEGVGGVMTDRPDWLRDAIDAR